MSFVTDMSLYYYKMMPFSLKNARATYQRLVNKMFADQIGRMIEVYVDDLLTKSTKAEDHIANLTKTFNTLRAYKMKLNLAKCAFGVITGKFLGFLVTERGIEANPDKIWALMEMKPLTNLKEIQRLTGRMTALSRFVSKATDHCYPFFKAIKKGKNAT